MTPYLLFVENVVQLGLEVVIASSIEWPGGIGSRLRARFGSSNPSDPKVSSFF